MTKKRTGPSQRKSVIGGADLRALDKLSTPEAGGSAIQIPGPTKSELSKWLKLGERAGTVRTARESATVAAALLAVGIAQADAEGAERLTIRHVKTGWNRLLSVCVGNTPPHRCFRRSVLDREERVMEEIPNARALRQQFLLKQG